MENQKKPTGPLCTEWLASRGLKDRRDVREGVEQAGDKFGGQWVTLQHCPHGGKPAAIVLAGPGKLKGHNAVARRDH